MIEIKDLCKNYGKGFKLEVSTEFANGKIHVLAGKNGAGKSTLLKCIAGLEEYTGSILICGYPNKSIEGKSKIAYCPEVPEVMDYISVYEHIKFISFAYDVINWEEKADDLIRIFNLESYKNKLGRELSKGTKQKVSICNALIRSDALIILDEPFVGLDPFSIQELKKCILKKIEQDNCTFILSTHVLESVNDLWDTVYIMNNGRIVNISHRNEKDTLLNIFMGNSK